MADSANPSPWPDDASAGYSFSTDELPAMDRLGIFREVVGLQMARLDMEPLPDHSFHARGTVRAFPGLFALWSESSPVRVGRTRPLLSDGDDSYMLQWANCSGSVESGGREAVVHAGDAILMTCAEATGMVLPSAFKTVTLKIPRKALGRSAHDANAWLLRPLPCDSEALKLLFCYVTLLKNLPAAAAPELQQMAVMHVHDLMALALGATRDGAEIARGRGLRAARLSAIENDIRKNLSDEHLSATVIARQRGLTPRVVQMLFENDGTTFTQFVLSERLAQARRMLASRRYDDRRIAEVAFACGFGDVSYFNRKFRARYGETPSDVRNGDYHA
jgi:AraC-like DNA-binding protein